MNLSIIGGGAWGTALSLALASQFETVRLWVYEADLAAQMKSTRETSAFLPGFRLRDNIEPTSNLREALEGTKIVAGVMPSQHARAIYSAMLPHLKASSIIVSATKGLEKGSLLRMSQVIEQVCQPRFEARVVVLSGPTFAREIAQGEPAALVAGSTDLALARQVQSAF